MYYCGAGFVFTVICVKEECAIKAFCWRLCEGLSNNSVSEAGSRFN